MDLDDPKYARFALCGEMLDAVRVVREFDPAVVEPFVEAIRGKRRVFLTGEGSSRIFPAKRAVCGRNRETSGPFLFTDGSTQALEYPLADAAVFGASNSGRTKELVRLFRKLEAERHGAYFGMTASPDSAIAAIAPRTHVLACGPERAVAATKSVVEQALFYQALFDVLAGRPSGGLGEAAEKIGRALRAPVDPAIAAAAAGPGRLYFAGRSDGVAEELALKTNEIARKPSGYLEGTYAVHGVEEVLDPADVVVVVDPFADEEEKFEECLSAGVGLTVVAISSRRTRFPTILVDDDSRFAPYIQLAAGWNLLVEVGLARGVELDTPRRARKIGNEVKID